MAGRADEAISCDSWHSAPGLSLPGGWVARFATPRSRPDKHDPSRGRSVSRASRDHRHPVPARASGARSLQRHGDPTLRADVPPRTRSVARSLRSHSRLHLRHGSKTHPLAQPRPYQINCHPEAKRSEAEGSPRAAIALLHLVAKMVYLMVRRVS